MPKNLLVAAVYAPSDRNAVWLGLQQRFLAELTDATYDLGVYLNRVDVAPFRAAGVEVLGRADVAWATASREHAAALNNLAAACRDRLHDYDNFLLLDSDAFPCQAGWFGRLLRWMRETDLLTEKLFAAPCRAENLDTFPHPCAFFMRRQYLEAVPDLDFSVAPHANLVGYGFEDVGCRVAREVGGRHAWLPLLRSNVWNAHPVLAAVYGGLFYHHGSGSRPLETRSVVLRTHDTSFPRHRHADAERQLFLEISKNPKIFIQQLLGS